MALEGATDPLDLSDWLTKQQAVLDDLRALDQCAHDAAARRAEAIHDAIVRLSPWLRHHARCARVIAAAPCDCGLQAALAPYRWSI